ncbi:oxygenase MpaB family protein [Promicromonospora vindobonensis]|uniref:Oxygenase MpaB family protein n=1 Tax=Promicromonospora vindobonensis TaxID=195748 RepID=A0ABW5W1A1_9MICO
MVRGDAANDVGQPAALTYPRRFRSAEARGARIGRPLRLLGRVRGVDEALMERIGRAFFEADDAGAALAAAMRLPSGVPGRVSHRQLRAALAGPATEPEFGRLHRAEDDRAEDDRAEDDRAEDDRAEDEIGPLGRDRSINRPNSSQVTDLSAQPEQPTELSAAPRALREFLAEVTTVPDWVDWELVDTGAAVLRRLGQNGADVLLQLSLVGGYRFGGPTDLLAATGALTGGTLRRLAETQEWTVGLSEPGSLRPYGSAWRATVHVRAMHALVNASFLGRTDPDDAASGSAGPVGTGPDRTARDAWDTARWGLPINQADQAATLGLFDATLILGCRALGVRIPPSDSRALMHLWKWVGHLMGVHPDFLVDDEWARHRINYHVLLAQADISDAGPRLAQAVVAAQTDRTYPGPSWWQPARAWLERERLPSMLTMFLGPRSMRELGLPLRPPWAHAYLLPLNVWRYHLLGRTRRGRERLDRWGRRRSDAILASYRAWPEPSASVTRTGAETGSQAAES